MRDVRRIGERGAGYVGGQEKYDRVLSGRPQSFRHQRQPVDDCCSPAREGMAQNSGTRAVTFHGEMDRCRESQGWTTACNRMSERDGKDQGEDSPKQAGSCWFARPCRLATSDGAFADAMTSFSGVTFVLFCFVFVFMLSLKPRPFVQPSFDMQAPQ